MGAKKIVASLKKQLAEDAKWTRAARETWTGAAGREGADEALINALGVEAAGKLLGVERPTENGETTAEALAAFGEYAAAFRDRIAEELRTETIDRCAYCTCEVTPQAEGEPAPAAADDAAWALLAKEHATDCEWIKTRAHRREAR